MSDPRNKLPTLPPGPIGIEDIYQMQLQLAEQVASLIGMQRLLMWEIGQLHEAMRPHNLRPLVKQAAAAAE